MGEESDTQSYPGPSRKFMSELGFEPRTPNSSDVCLPLSSAVTQTQKAEASAPRRVCVRAKKKRGGQEHFHSPPLPVPYPVPWARPAGTLRGRRAGRHPQSTCAGTGSTKDTAGGEGRARGGPLPTPLKSAQVGRCFPLPWKRDCPAGWASSAKCPYVPSVFQDRELAPFC